MQINIEKDDENYKEAVLRTAIIICWALLGVCFVIKLFGGHFFDVMCGNKRFIAVCDYVNSHIYMQFIIGTISSLITYTLFYLAILRKKWFDKHEIIIMLVTTPIFVILRLFCTIYNLEWALLIINLTQLFVVPFCFKRDKKTMLIRWFTPFLLLGNIFNLLAQIISAFVKSVEIVIDTNNFLIAIIYSIDMYFMLSLYYFYSISIKGEKNMSWIMNWLFGKSETQLEGMKAKRVAKIEKLQAEIKAIDEELAKKSK